MSWSVHHGESEKLANLAEVAFRAGRNDEAGDLYKRAADAELRALDSIGEEKPRTLGITAVSATSLFYKARAFQLAQATAYRYLSNPALPVFAVEQLRGLVQTMWAEETARVSGVEFTRDDVLVSVKGGEIVYGGAPLDLILTKVEEVRAMFYRTIEFIMNRPLRRRGAPPLDIQDLFRPWLFQAPPSSYQFAVRVQKPKQMELFPGSEISVEEVTSKFLEIVESSVTDPDGALQRLVPDVEYRTTFIKLARNLAPTGKSFSSLEIRSRARTDKETILLEPVARKLLSDVLKKLKPSTPLPPEAREEKLVGVLRAVHLDEDWLEVTVQDDGEKHIRVEKAGDAIDDVVGPMVNRRVTVEVTVTKSGKYHYRDIQSVE
ncbi:MAG: hypothetical protein HZA89_00810 [Verrucomicrobia bacterium]|nr:hypothetical protein [Verrucomicrobiota bacterium]